MEIRRAQLAAIAQAAELHRLCWNRPQSSERIEDYLARHRVLGDNAVHQVDLQGADMHLPAGRRLRAIQGPHARDIGIDVLMPALGWQQHEIHWQAASAIEDFSNPDML